MVEQRTENPRVGCSIHPLATIFKKQELHGGPPKAGDNVQMVGLPSVRDRARSHAGVGLLALLALVTAGGFLHPGAPVHAQADFEGIWVVNPGRIGGPPGEDEIRYTPAGRAEWERFGADVDPSFRCIMPGIPRGFTDPYPIEIIQQDHQIVILHEYYHQVRRIFMDGREAPDYWPNTLGGYSTGRWEGETLIVRTTHMSPDNLMDIHGRPFSGADDTYVIERFTRDGELLSRIAEVHDPTYYETPFVISHEWKLEPDGEIWEYACDPQFGDVGPGGAIQGGSEG